MARLVGTGGFEVLGLSYRTSQHPMVGVSGFARHLSRPPGDHKRITGVSTVILPTRA
jgi:hypothetical protein